MQSAVRAVFSVSLLVVACGASRSAPPAQPNPDLLAARAQQSFDVGDTERALELATRALVVRIARHGIDHPDAARSFLQLGDMRRALGQLAWATQSYRRGLEVLAVHRKSAPRTPRVERLERALRERLRALDGGARAASGERDEP